MNAAQPVLSLFRAQHRVPVALIEASGIEALRSPGPNDEFWSRGGFQETEDLGWTACPRCHAWLKECAAQRLYSEHQCASGLWSIALPLGGEADGLLRLGPFHRADTDQRTPNGFPLLTEEALAHAISHAGELSQLLGAWQSAERQRSVLEQTTEALRRENKDTHAAFNQSLAQSNELTLWAEAGQTVVYAAPNTERLLGVSAADILGAPVLDLAHPDSRGPLEDALQHAPREERPSDPFRVRLRHADKGFRSFDIYVRRGGSPEPRTVITGQDVTRYAVADEETERLRTRLEALEAAVLGFALLLGPDGVCREKAGALPNDWPEGRPLPALMDHGGRELNALLGGGASEAASAGFCALLAGRGYRVTPLRRSPGGGLWTLWRPLDERGPGVAPAPLRRRPPQLRAAPKEKKQLIPQARLYEQLRNETLRFRRYGSPLSLLTAKSGPLPPEALLERIYLRETDLVAALEERRLVIALPETDFQGAVSLDRRLGRDLAKSGADAPWRSGLATLSHDASAPEALVEAAAAALTLSETWN